MGSKASTEAAPDEDEDEEESDDDFFGSLDCDGDAKKDVAKRDTAHVMKVVSSKHQLVPTFGSSTTKAPVAKPVAKKKLIPMMTPAAMAAQAKAEKEAKKEKVSAVTATSEAYYAVEAEKKRREEEAASGKPSAKDILEASSDDPTCAPLPRGDLGVVWEALEDSIVRAEKDIKTAKRGGLQAGERCTQTGPWRADASGRVRMPMKGPRGLEGWVTLDERRCQNALDQTFGNLCFMIPKEEKKQVQEAASRKAVDDDLYDLLLDGYERDQVAQEEEGEKQSKKDSLAAEAAASGMSIRQYRKTQAEILKREAEAEAEEEKEEEEAVPYTEEAPAVTKPGNDASAASAAVATQLTEAQKKLRNTQKKLRDLETLEQKVANTGSMTPDQKAKLEKADEIRATVAQAEAEVAAEASLEASRKKKKKKGGAADKKKRAASGAQERGGSCLRAAVTYGACGIVLAAWSWSYYRSII